MTKVKTFGEFAGKIVEKGYCPIPIVPNDKKAAVKDWTHYRFKLGDEKKYADCGIGFLCGQEYSRLSESTPIQRIRTFWTTCVSL